MIALNGEDLEISTSSISSGLGGETGFEIKATNNLGQERLKMSFVAGGTAEDNENNIINIKDKISVEVDGQVAGEIDDDTAIMEFRQVSEDMAQGYRVVYPQEKQDYLTDEQNIKFEQIFTDSAIDKMLGSNFDLNSEEAVKMKEFLKECAKDDRLGAALVKLFKKMEGKIGASEEKFNNAVNSTAAMLSDVIAKDPGLKEKINNQLYTTIAKYSKSGGAEKLCEYLTQVRDKVFGNTLQEKGKEVEIAGSKVKMDVYKSKDGEVFYRMNADQSIKMKIDGQDVVFGKYTEFLADENGNLMKDESGQPIPRNGSVGYAGDGSYAKVVISEDGTTLTSRKISLPSYEKAATGVEVKQSEEAETETLEEGLDDQDKRAEQKVEETEDKEKVRLERVDLGGGRLAVPIEGAAFKRSADNKITDYKVVNKDGDVLFAVKDNNIVPLSVGVSGELFFQVGDERVSVAGTLEEATLKMRDQIVTGLDIMLKDPEKYLAVNDMAQLEEFKENLQNGTVKITLITSDNDVKSDAYYQDGVIYVKYIGGLEGVSAVDFSRSAFHEFAHLIFEGIYRGPPEESDLKNTLSESFAHTLVAKIFKPISNFKSGIDKYINAYQDGLRTGGRAGAVSALLQEVFTNSTYNKLIKAAGASFGNIKDRLSDIFNDEEKTGFMDALNILLGTETQLPFVTAPAVFLITDHGITVTEPKRKVTIPFVDEVAVQDKTMVAAGLMFDASYFGPDKEYSPETLARYISKNPDFIKEVLTWCVQEKRDVRAAEAMKSVDISLIDVEDNPSYIAILAYFGNTKAQEKINTFEEDLWLDIADEINLLVNNAIDLKQGGREKESIVELKKAIVLLGSTKFCDFDYRDYRNSTRNKVIEPVGKIKDSLLKEVQAIEVSSGKDNIDYLQAFAHLGITKPTYKALKEEIKKYDLGSFIALSKVNLEAAKSVAGGLKSSIIEKMFIANLKTGNISDIQKFIDISDAKNENLGQLSPSFFREFAKLYKGKPDAKAWLVLGSLFVKTYNINVWNTIVGLAEYALEYDKGDAVISSLLNILVTVHISENPMRVKMKGKYGNTLEYLYGLLSTREGIERCLNRGSDGVRMLSRIVRNDKEKTIPILKQVLSEKYSENAKLYYDLMDLEIFAFNRYLDPDVNSTIKTIVNNRQGNNTPGDKPVVTIIACAEDRNGAFDSMFTAYSQEAMFLISTGFHVMYYEAETPDQIAAALKDSFEIAGKKSDSIIFIAHGTREFMQFSYRKDGDFTVYNAGKLKPVSYVLADNGTIVLYGCSTGEGRKEKNNMANKMREVFPQAVKLGIFAPDDKTTGIHNIYFKKGLIEKVEFIVYGGGTYRAQVTPKTEVGSFTRPLSLITDHTISSEAVENDILLATAKALGRESDWMQFKIDKAIKVDEDTQSSVIVDKDLKVLAFTFSKFSEDSALVIKAGEANTAPEKSINILITSAKGGNQDAAYILMALADNGNTISEASLEKLNISAFVTQARQGNKGAVDILDKLDNYGNASIENALKHLNPAAFVKQAGQGGKDAIDALGNLTAWGNVSAKTSLSNLNPTVFIRQAKQGDKDAISILDTLVYYSGNNFAKNALKTLNSFVFIKEAKEDDKKVLNLLVSHGNVSAGAALGLMSIINAKGLDNAIYSSAANILGNLSSNKPELITKEGLSNIISILDTKGLDSKLYSGAFSILTFVSTLKPALLPEGILFVVKYAPEAPWYRANMAILIGTLGIDMSKCATKESFSEEFANKLNIFAVNNQTADDASTLKDIFGKAAVMINLIHDREAELDNHSDIIRKVFVEKLDNRAAYYMIALGGANLYPSSFRMLYEQKVRGNLDFIKDVTQDIDKDAGKAVDFILVLSSYNVMQEVISMDAGYFMNTIEKVLNNTQDITVNAAKLVSVSTAIFNDKEMEGYKGRFEGMLLDGYSLYKSQKNLDAQGSVGYLIKLNQNELTNTELKDIAKSLPDILRPDISKQWLADRTLTAVLVFHDDEKWLGITKDTFVNTFNFSSKIIEQGKTYELTSKKPVNGITFRLIITLDNEKMQEYMDDPDIDIVSLRSHIYNNESDLSQAKAQNKNKLIFLGGCGSFGLALDSIISDYSGNYFISDSNTGEGAVNNKITYYMMQSIARGKAKWDSVKADIVDKIPESSGIIWPDDNSMLIFEFLGRFKVEENKAQGLASNLIIDHGILIQDITLANIGDVIASISDIKDKPALKEKLSEITQAIDVLVKENKLTGEAAEKYMGQLLKIIQDNFTKEDPVRAELVGALYSITNPRVIPAGAQIVDGIKSTKEVDLNKPGALIEAELTKDMEYLDTTYSKDSKLTIKLDRENKIEIKEIIDAKTGVKAELLDKGIVRVTSPVENGKDQLVKELYPIGNEGNYGTRILSGKVIEVVPSGKSVVGEDEKGNPLNITYTSDTTIEHTSSGSDLIKGSYKDNITGIVTTVFEEGGILEKVYPKGLNEKSAPDDKDLRDITYITKTIIKFTPDPKSGLYKIEVKEGSFRDNATGIVTKGGFKGGVLEKIYPKGYNDPAGITYTTKTTIKFTPQKGDLYKVEVKEGSFKNSITVAVKNLSTGKSDDLVLIDAVTRKPVLITQVIEGGSVKYGGIENGKEVTALLRKPGAGKEITYQSGQALIARDNQDITFIVTIKNGNLYINPAKGTQAKGFREGSYFLMDSDKKWTYADIKIRGNVEWDGKQWKLLDNDITKYSTKGTKIESKVEGIKGLVPTNAVTLRKDASENIFLQFTKGRIVYKSQIGDSKAAHPYTKTNITVSSANGQYRIIDFTKNDELDKPMILECWLNPEGGITPLVDSPGVKRTFIGTVEMNGTTYESTGQTVGLFGKFEKTSFTVISDHKAPNGYYHVAGNGNITFKDGHTLSFSGQDRNNGSYFVSKVSAGRGLKKPEQSILDSFTVPAVQSSTKTKSTISPVYDDDKSIVFLYAADKKSGNYELKANTLQPIDISFFDIKIDAGIRNYNAPRVSILITSSLRNNEFDQEVYYQDQHSEIINTKYETFEKGWIATSKTLSDTETIEEKLPDGSLKVTEITAYAGTKQKDHRITIYDANNEIIAGRSDNYTEFTDGTTSYVFRDKNFDLHYAPAWGGFIESFAYTLNIVGCNLRSLIDGSASGNELNKETYSYMAAGYGKKMNERLDSWSRNMTNSLGIFSVPVKVFNNGLIGISEGFLGGITMPVSLACDPIGTGNGFVDMVTELPGQFASNPVRTAAQFFGFGKGMGVWGKGLKLARTEVGGRLSGTLGSTFRGEGVYGKILFKEPVATSSPLLGQSSIFGKFSAANFVQGQLAMAKMFGFSWALGTIGGEISGLFDGDKIFGKGIGGLAGFFILPKFTQIRQNIKTFGESGQITEAKINENKKITSTENARAPDKVERKTRQNKINQPKEEPITLPVTQMDVAGVIKNSPTLSGANWKTKILNQLIIYTNAHSKDPGIITALKETLRVIQKIDKLTSGELKIDINSKDLTISDALAQAFYEFKKAGKGDIRIGQVMHAYLRLSNINARVRGIAITQLAGGGKQSAEWVAELLATKIELNGKPNSRIILEKWLSKGYIVSQVGSDPFLSLDIFKNMCKIVELVKSPTGEGVVESNKPIMEGPAGSKAQIRILGPEAIAARALAIKTGTMSINSLKGIRSVGLDELQVLITNPQLIYAISEASISMKQGTYNKAAEQVKTWLTINNELINLSGKYKDFFTASKDSKGRGVASTWKINGKYLSEVDSIFNKYQNSLPNIVAENSNGSLKRGGVKMTKEGFRDIANKWANAQRLIEGRDVCFKDGDYFTMVRGYGNEGTTIGDRYESMFTLMRARELTGKGAEKLIKTDIDKMIDKLYTRTTNSIDYVEAIKQIEKANGGRGIVDLTTATLQTSMPMLELLNKDIHIISETSLKIGERIQQSLQIKTESAMEELVENIKSNPTEVIIIACLEGKLGSLAKKTLLKIKGNDGNPLIKEENITEITGEDQVVLSTKVKEFTDGVKNNKDKKGEIKVLIAPLEEGINAAEGAESASLHVFGLQGLTGLVQLFARVGGMRTGSEGSKDAYHYVITERENMITPEERISIEEMTPGDRQTKGLKIVNERASIIDLHTAYESAGRVSKVVNQKITPEISAEIERAVLGESKIDKLNDLIQSLKDKLEGKTEQIREFFRDNDLLQLDIKSGEFTDNFTSQGGKVAYVYLNLLNSGKDTQDNIANIFDIKSGDVFDIETGENIGAGLSLLDMASNIVDAGLENVGIDKISNAYKHINNFGISIKDIYSQGNEQKGIFINSLSETLLSHDDMALLSFILDNLDQNKAGSKELYDNLTGKIRNYTKAKEVYYNNYEAQGKDYLSSSISKLKTNFAQNSINKNEPTVSDFSAIEHYRDNPGELIALFDASASLESVSSAEKAFKLLNKLGLVDIKVISELKGIVEAKNAKTRLNILTGIVKANKGYDKDIAKFTDKLNEKYKDSESIIITPKQISDIAKEINAEDPSKIEEFGNALLGIFSKEDLNKYLQNKAIQKELYTIINSGLDITVEAVHAIAKKVDAKPQDVYAVIGYQDKGIIIENNYNKLQDYIGSESEGFINFINSITDIGTLSDINFNAPIYVEGMHKATNKILETAGKQVSANQFIAVLNKQPFKIEINTEDPLISNMYAEDSGQIAFDAKFIKLISQIAEVDPVLANEVVNAKTIHEIGHLLRKRFAWSLTDEKIEAQLTSLARILARKTGVRGAELENIQVKLTKEVKDGKEYYSIVLPNGIKHTGLEKINIQELLANIKLVANGENTLINNVAYSLWYDFKFRVPGGNIGERVKETVLDLKELSFLGYFLSSDAYKKQGIELIIRNGKEDYETAFSELMAKRVTEINAKFEATAGSSKTIEARQPVSETNNENVLTGVAASNTQLADNQTLASGHTIKEVVKPIEMSAQEAIEKINAVEGKAQIDAARDIVKGWLVAAALNGTRGSPSVELDKTLSSPERLPPQAFLVFTSAKQLLAEFRGVLDNVPGAEKQKLIDSFVSALESIKIGNFEKLFGVSMEDLNAMGIGATVGGVSAVNCGVQALQVVLESWAGKKISRTELAGKITDEIVFEIENDTIADNVKSDIVQKLIEGKIGDTVIKAVANQYGVKDVISTTVDIDKLKEIDTRFILWVPEHFMPVVGYGAGFFITRTLEGNDVGIRTEDILSKQKPGAGKQIVIITPDKTKTPGTEDYYGATPDLYSLFPSVVTDLKNAVYFGKGETKALASGHTIHAIVKPVKPVFPQADYLEATGVKRAYELTRYNAQMVAYYIAMLSYATQIRIYGYKKELSLKASMEDSIQRINDIESNLKDTSDAEIRTRIEELRTTIKDRISAGEKEQDILDSVLTEVFALTKEAIKRADVIEKGKNYTYYNVQLMGAMTMCKRMIAEMATGEGKTFTVGLSGVINALSGLGVHIVTANSTLAERDLKTMGAMYEFLGLTSAVILPEGKSYIYKNGELKECTRKEAYLADITYGTKDEFGFDYLRDNMAYSKDDQVQRGRHFALVDEIDNVLIDEARTPLVISAATGKEDVNVYYAIDNIIKGLAEADYKKETENGRDIVYLTEEGVDKVSGLIAELNLPESSDIDIMIRQSLQANFLFIKDKHYIVQDKEIVILDDENRPKYGSRYGDGLHEAIEAKEHNNGEDVEVKQPSDTLASITLQTYFNLYEGKAGATGTAQETKDEVKEIYNLDVMSIPTNMPVIRVDNAGRIYKTKQEKFEATIEQILKDHESGRPVLIGTNDVDESEELAAMLEAKAPGLQFRILNAKQTKDEAEIVAQAGQIGAITIATNMAGRGTDIKLGEGVKEKGGLHILGTEFSKTSERIDRQLRGRSGRNGDAGASDFNVSLEDDIFKILGKDAIEKLSNELDWEGGIDIATNAVIQKALNEARAKISARDYDARKRLVEYDVNLGKIREAVYKERQEILEMEMDDLYSLVISTAENTLNHLFENYAVYDIKEEELIGSIEELFNIRIEYDDLKGDIEALKARISRAIDVVYREKFNESSEEEIRQAVLYAIDTNFKEFKSESEKVKSYSFGSGEKNKDFAAFVKRINELYETMNASIQDDILGSISRGSEYHYVSKVVKIKVEDEKELEDISSVNIPEKKSIIKKTMNALTAKNSLSSKVIMTTMLVLSIGGTVSAEIAKSGAVVKTMDAETAAAEYINSLTGTELTQEEVDNIISDVAEKQGIETPESETLTSLEQKEQIVSTTTDTTSVVTAAATIAPVLLPPVPDTTQVTQPPTIVAPGGEDKDTYIRQVIETYREKAAQGSDITGVQQLFNTVLLSDEASGVYQFVYKGNRHDVKNSVPVMKLTYDYKGLLDAYSKGYITLEVISTGEKVNYSDNKFDSKIVQYKDWFRNGGFRIFDKNTGEEYYSIVQYESRDRVFNYDGDTGELIRNKKKVREYELSGKYMRTVIIPGSGKIDIAKINTAQKAFDEGGQEVDALLNAQNLKVKRAAETLVTLERADQIWIKMTYATLLDKNGKKIAAFADEASVKGNKAKIDGALSKGGTLVGADYTPYVLNNRGHSFEGEMLACAKDADNNLNKVWEKDASGNAVLWTYNHQSGAWDRKELSGSIEDIKKDIKENAMYSMDSFDKKTRKMSSRIMTYKEMKLRDAVPDAVLDKDTGNELLIGYDGTDLDEAKKDLEIIKIDIEEGEGLVQNISIGGKKPLYSKTDSWYVEKVLKLWGAEVSLDGDYIKLFNRGYNDMPESEDIFKADDNRWYRKGKEIRDDKGELVSYEKGNLIIFGRLAAEHRFKLEQQYRANYEKMSMGLTGESRVIKHNLRTQQTAVLTGESYIDMYRNVPEYGNYIPNANLFIWNYQGDDHVFIIDESISKVEKTLEREKTALEKTKTYVMGRFKGSVSVAVPPPQSSEIKQDAQVVAPVVQQSQEEKEKEEQKKQDEPIVAQDKIVTPSIRGFEFTPEAQAPNAIFIPGVEFNTEGDITPTMQFNLNATPNFGKWLLLKGGVDGLIRFSNPLAGNFDTKKSEYTSYLNNLYDMKSRGGINIGTTPIDDEIATTRKVLNNLNSMSSSPIKSYMGGFDLDASLMLKERQLKDQPECEINIYTKGLWQGGPDFENKTRQELKLAFIMGSNEAYVLKSIGDRFKAPAGFSIGEGQDVTEYGLKFKEPINLGNFTIGANPFVLKDNLGHNLGIGIPMEY
ncbi:MAG: hypothetical protein WC312_05885, partial [Candidatus Omnitrophota bacterium]